MKYIEKISTNKIPVILTGDFNSKPDSSAYHGITNGKSKNINCKNDGHTQ